MQCHYEMEEEHDKQHLAFSTPACNSDNDNPRAYELHLAPGDKVVTARCRSGALVDSLELITAAGQSLCVGGVGGGDVCQVILTET